MSAPTPPRWTEAILRVLLDPESRDTVSGDLLEEYRESVHPARGEFGADLWYVRQVAEFAWRASRLWVVLFVASWTLRTVLDWYVPTRDFHLRSAVTTYVAISLLTAAGFSSSWRARSWVSGPLVGALTMLAAGLVNVAFVVAMFGMDHSPMTLAAIAGSGGLAEALTLPLMLVIPGSVLGGIGGLLAVSARRLLPRS